MTNDSVHTISPELSLILKASKIIDRNFLLANPVALEDISSFIRSSLFGLSDFYPLFDRWLKTKVLPGLVTGERSILLEQNRGRFSGLAIVKDDGLEKKLCCLRVMPEFQGSGAGLRLFERAFETLDNDMPLLSIAEEQKDTFNKLFSYYGFELAKKYKNHYRPLKDELSFNGLIDQYFEPISTKNHRSPSGLILPKR